MIIFWICVVIGIVVVSILLGALLKRAPKPTLGVLLGLLVGAVVGLWPYQQPVRPAPGDTIKGVVQTDETLALLPEEDWPTAWFRPSGGQVAGGAGLVVAGFLITSAVAAFGRERKKPAPSTAG